MAGLGSCHPAASKREARKNGTGDGSLLTIALAGNANVGKSVIFNQLTGSHQTIGNWPGKTVEKAVGALRFDGRDISVVDLPGIYSLSTFSLEEVVTREYIAREKPDVIIDVIGAPVLERNLFFTLQLMELEVPMVVCVNQMDIAEGRGITIDTGRLEAALGIPVVPTVASRGTGMRDLVATAVEVAEHGLGPMKSRPKSVNGIGASVDRLTGLIESEQISLGYPSQWVAIKLLEDDAEIKKAVGLVSEDAVRASEALAAEIEKTHGQSPFAIITSDRYSLASQIASDSQKQVPVKSTFSDRLDRLTTHKVFGYMAAFTVLAGLLLWTFTVGSFLSNLLSNLLGFLAPLNPRLNGPIASILWNGAFGGLVAGVTLVIPYVMPFYLVLAMIEDSGILTRVAFMFDNFMHTLGLHGKAIIPLILGYGCNVPAIYTCRVMGTRREKLLAAFAITFIPCTARTIIILGLVATFVNMQWALALYAIDLLVVILLGRAALKAVPGQSTGLTMEMHSFRLPSFNVAVKQTWARTKSIMYMVFPIYLIGGAIVQGMYALGWLAPINSGLSLITVKWLGLPAITGILLVFGIIRKELIVLALVPLYGTADFRLLLTSVQLIVLAFIGMLYLPCVATFTTLVKEFGWKPAAAISAANLVSAVLLGGILSRLLTPLF